VKDSAAAVAAEKKKKEAAKSTLETFHLFAILGWMRKTFLTALAFHFMLARKVRRKRRRERHARNSFGNNIKQQQLSLWRIRKHKRKAFYRKNQGISTSMKSRFRVKSKGITIFEISIS